MELVLEIGLGVLAAVIGILSFFVKRSLNDVEKLKAAQTDAKVVEREVENLEKHLDRVEETMYKKFAGVHAKQEKQEELNGLFKETLASINAKLDILIKNT